MGMLVLMHLVVIFAFLTNSYLDGAKKSTIASWLGLLWLGCVIAAVIFFRWQGLGVAAMMTLFAPLLLRGAAARTAALMGAGAPSGGGSYPGPPPIELLRISRILGDYSGLEDPARMIAEMTAPGPSKKDIALDQLLDAIEGRASTSAILRRVGVDREALREMYRTLVVAGAGQWAGAHFAAASALFLRILLISFSKERGSACQTQRWPTISSSTSEAGPHYQSLLDLSRTPFA